jgi:tRNA(adenine34) deaminase
MTRSAIDIDMMRKCIALSAAAGKDLPIVAMVCRERDVLSTARNEVYARKDMSAHAEVLALNAAREQSGALDGCTLYSTVEPCPMCCFLARQAGIERVVYALTSPVMGGVSKWNVLRDPQLSELIPEVFGGVPEVHGGVLAAEAAAVWENWNSFIWSVVRKRGCFVELQEVQQLAAIPSQHRMLHSLLALFKP